MSNLDGENSYVYNKTLSGLDSFGDGTFGDVVITGTLTVIGATSFESNVDMNLNFIQNLADGVLPQDAATVNQLTALGAGYLPLAGGTMTPTNTGIDFNNSINADITNLNFLQITGTNLEIRNVDYTFPAADAAAPGDVLASDAAGNLSWNSPLASTQLDVNSPSATTLVLMGTAGVPAGSNIQSVFACDGIAANSATIDTQTGKIVSGANIISTAGIIQADNADVLGLNLKTRIGTAGNILTNINGTDGTIRNAVGNLATTGAEIGFNPDPAGRAMAVGTDVFNDVGTQSVLFGVDSATGQLEAGLAGFAPVLTTLPHYNRHHYNWTTRQNPAQASASTNWFCSPHVGGYNPLITAYRPDMTITATDFDNGVSGTEGGGAQYCIWAPYNGVVKKVQVISPYPSQNLTCNLSYGSVPTTNAGLTAIASGVFAPSGANTGHTLPILAGGIISADSFLVFRVTETYTAGQHAQGEQWWNISVIIDYLYT